MHPLTQLSLATAFFTLGACAASSAEINTARTASYSCSASEILGKASEVLIDRVAPLSTIDPDRGVAVTRPRWHDPNGRRRTIEYPIVEPEDVLVSVVVTLRGNPSQPFRINLQSAVFSVIEGSPQPVPLPPGNAARPRWVEAREDELRVDIHKALSHCAIADKPATSPNSK